MLSPEKESSEKDAEMSSTTVDTEIPKSEVRKFRPQLIKSQTIHEEESDHEDHQNYARNTISTVKKLPKEFSIPEIDTDAETEGDQDDLDFLQLQYNDERTDDARR